MLVSGEVLGSAERAAACVLLLALAACLCGPGGARAQSAAAPPRQGNFNIDFVSGPIIGPSRVVSLGGAYTALGYGIDNAVITPAAYAARTLWDLNWFEFDVTVDYNPNTFRNIVFNNNGKFGLSSSDLLFVTLGASAMLGDLGFGGLVRYQHYRLGDHTQLDVVLANYGACYSLFGGQLLIGAGARTASIDFNDIAAHQPLANASGTGPELGVILGIADRPYRIGLAARSALRPELSSAPALTGVTFPKAISLPAELQVGFAYQFGNRPLNRRWVNPHERARELRNEMLSRRLQRQRAQADRERTAAQRDQPLAWLAEPHDEAFWKAEDQRMAQEELELQQQIAQAEARHKEALNALSRKYLLVSADLLVVGTTPEGVGLESFLAQEQQVAGRRPSFSFRVGAEGEPIQNFLKLRVGSYLEPARFDDVSPRVHVTVGSDVKLFSWNMFGLLDRFDVRITASLDVAERYRNFGLSVGIWH